MASATQDSVMIRCHVCGHFHNVLRTTTFHIDGKERIICLNDVRTLYTKIERHFPKRRKSDERRVTVV